MMKSNKHTTPITVPVKVDIKELDEALEKAEKLVDYLKKAKSIVDDLASKKY